MGLRGRPLKLLKIIAFVALAVFLAPWLWVQGEAWMFRYRAQRILRDVRTLQSHPPDSPDFISVLNRWNHWNVHCSAQDCLVSEDLFLPSPDSYQPDDPGVWGKLFRSYGGRHAIVRASIEMHEGRIWRLFYVIAIAVPTARDPYGEAYDNSASAGVIIGGFSPPDAWRGLTLHPHFVIEKAQPPRTPYDANLMGRFDSRADPADFGRLSSVNLSCITGWTRCRKPEELMPEAAAQYAREEPELARLRKEHVCSPEMIRLMAHYAMFPGVVEMTGSTNWGDRPIPVVKLVEDFAPQNPSRRRKTWQLAVYDVKKGLVKTVPEAIRPGGRFILLSENPGDAPLVTAEVCGIVPLTPENLALVKSGIADRNVRANSQQAPGPSR